MNILGSSSCALTDMTGRFWEEWTRASDVPSTLVLIWWRPLSEQQQKFQRTHSARAEITIRIPKWSNLTFLLSMIMNLHVQQQ